MNEARKLAIVLLAVMAFGLVALAVEWLRMRLSGWLVLVIVSLIVLVMALSIHPIRAHDHGRPELDGWFKSLTSRAKTACCDGSDATRLDDVDWESRDGRYRVRVEGEWVDVPEDAVIDGPNRAGPAMVWPWWKNGQRAVRCFMPGSMT
jgi:hypothetical protein